MTKTNLSDTAAREFFPGFHGKMVHAETMTFAYWQIDKGASIAPHRHPHEQVVNMLEGQFELVLEGTRHRLGPGEVLVIPSNAEHGGTAISDCRILDVFHPVREDYR